MQQRVVKDKQVFLKDGVKERVREREQVNINSYADSKCRV